MKKRIRKSVIKRETNEVDIKGELILDGKEEKIMVNTGIKFLDHLLSSFAFHGFFDLTLKAKGDLTHHIIEDIGLALGSAFRSALGDCKGIKRFGHSYVIMESVLARMVVDMGGRPFYKQDNLYNRALPAIDFCETDNITLQDIDKFMEGFSNSGKLNIHLSYTYYAEQSGKGNAHHLLEGIFKALGLALDQAVQIDPRRKGIPSTKGIID